VSGRIFTLRQIARFRREAKAQEAERAAKVRTEAARDLLRASRTVHALDGQVITIMDGDVLDGLLAVEREAFG
jgi:hypothetical protein